MSVSGNGVESQALAGSGGAKSTAANAVGTINPIYSQLATGNVGYTPTQKADLLTASQQTLGGGQAAAAGAGGLYAARTGNAGGAAAAIDDSARNAMAQESQNSLDVENKDALLQQKNRDTGLQGLNDIYKTSTGAGVDYLNTANSSQQAAAARKLSWAKLGLQTAGSLAGA